MLETEGLDEVPEALMTHLEAAIDEVRPGQFAGYFAAGLLALQFQEALRAIAVQAAEERLLDHYMSQADETYGGN